MNWGYKILFTFLVFTGGMIFLVYKSMKTDFELVEKDYYKKELVYQEVIDGTTRANQLSSAVNLAQDETGIQLSLPAEMKNKQLSGEIFFYCSFDSRRDQKIKLMVDENATQLIPVTHIHPGAYTVKISWQEDGKNYFAEQYFTVV